METNVLELCDKSMTDQCAHSFCLKCSEISKEPPNCPTCLTEFQMPEGGMKDLKQIKFVERLNNINHISCDSCKENQAIKFCVECSFNYCSTCLEHHGRIPASSNHHLQPATTDKSKVRINVYSKCEEHSEEINLFCKFCGVTVCGRCLYLNHNSHEMIHFVEYFEYVKQQIELNLNEKQSHLEQAAASYKSSEIAMNNDVIEGSNLREEIQQRGETLKKAIDSIVDGLIKGVNEEIKLHQKEAHGIMKELKNMETDLRATTESLEQHLKDLDYENMFEIFSEIDFKETIFPKYSKQFSDSLSYTTNQEISSLRTIFGSLEKALSIKQVLQPDGAFQPVQCTLIDGKSKVPAAPQSFHRPSHRALY